MIGAIDAGTTSVRFVVVDRQGQIVQIARRPLQLDTPHPGWVQQDAQAMLQAIAECIAEIEFKDLAAIGITNQRESVLAWEECDDGSAKPLSPIISWLDTRTAELLKEEIAPLVDQVWLTHKTGLPLSTYFSAAKIKWLLQQQEQEQLDQALRKGSLRFGTVDTWILRWLTAGQVYATDASNASRTQLMNLETLSWDPALLKLFSVPACYLPTIRPSSFDYGRVAQGPLQGVPILALLGDQQASLLGHGIHEQLRRKLTVGTSANLMVATKGEPLFLKGLVTTVLFSEKTEEGEEEEKQSSVWYGVEGPMAGGGSLVNWLRAIVGQNDLDELGARVEDAGGVSCVPAMAGWLSPWWDPQATGSLQGLTLNTQPGHLVHAIYEAICYTVKLLLERLGGNGHGPLVVDGGLSRSPLFGQILADTLGIPLCLPLQAERTVLGVAWLAGKRLGWWKQPFQHPSNHIYPNPDKHKHYADNYQRWLTLVQLA